MFSDPAPNNDNLPVLAEVSVEQGRLILLNVMIDKDLPAIIQFLKKEYTPKGDLNAAIEGFKEMFSSFAGSLKSHAFVVRLGEEILFEIELHLAELHFPYRRDFTPEEKDYYMVVLGGGFELADFTVYVRGLQLCLDYFGNSLGVQQILAQVDEGPNKLLQFRLFSEAGMTMPLGVTNPERPDLFVFSRPDTPHTAS